MKFKIFAKNTIIILLLILLPISISFGNAITNAMIDAFIWLIRLITIIIKSILSFLSDIVASIIDSARGFQIFDEGRPANIAWKIFLNLAYPFLVFATLYVAFQYILGKSEQAHRILWYIILAALFINFTFAFVKEAYGVVVKLEDSILGTHLELGKALKNIMFKTPSAASISEEFEDKIIISNDEANSDNKRYLAEITVYIINSFFYMISFISLVVIATLVVGRIVYITLMTGVAPLAIVSLAIHMPKQSIGFHQWLNTLFRWLTIVLIFVFLMLIGISLYQNIFQEVLEQSITSNQNAWSQFINYILAFLFISIWIFTSLKWSIEVGGVFGKWGERIGFGVLGLMGAGAAALGAGAWKPVKRRVNRILGTSLDSIGNRLQVSNIQALRGLGRNLSERGKALQKERLEIVKKDLEFAKERERLNPDSNALTNWLIQQIDSGYSKSPEMQKVLADTIKDLSQEQLKRIIQITNPQEARDRINYFTSLRKDKRIIYNALVDKFEKMSQKMLFEILKNLDEYGVLQSFNDNLSEMADKINEVIPVLKTRFSQGTDQINALVESFKKVNLSVSPDDFNRIHGVNQEGQARAFVIMANKDSKKARAFIVQPTWGGYLQNLFRNLPRLFNQLPNDIQTLLRSIQT